MKPGSRKSDDADLKRLKSLYEQAANAEPDARLDRAVLDRARQTAPRSGWVGPWAYGLAGALCLVLVIGVGLRQGLQFSEAPVDVREERAIEGEKLESDPSFAPQSGSPVTEGVPDMAQPAPTQQRAAAELSQAESEPLAADAARIFEDRQADPDMSLARIRELLEEGHEEQARQALDAFRELHPDADIPADLGAQLGETARARAGEEP